MQQILRLLFRIPPTWSLSFLLAGTLLGVSFLPDLRFSYDIETFFAADDPDVAFYEVHRRTFGNENDFLLVGIRNRAGIFKQDFLQKVDSLGQALKQFPGIEKVFSPTRLYEVVKSPFASLRIPLIPLDEPEQYAQSRQRIYESEIYTHSFFSADTQSLSLLLQKQSGGQRQTNDSLLLAVQSAVAAHRFDDFHLAGRMQTQYYYVSQMKKQMLLFAALAAILFLGALFFIFRNLQYVLLALGAVLLSQIGIFGMIGWLGIPIDLMLTLLPSLIFVISTSGSIHLITRFRQAYHSPAVRLAAIEKAVAETGLPNFLNALTTAIGFSSLAMIPVPPIQRFGLLVAGGILFSFLASLLFIFSILKLTAPPPLPAPLQSGKVAGTMIRFAEKRPLLLTNSFVLFVACCLYFSFQVRIDNHFLDDLNAASRIKQDLDFFDTHFAGIRPFEVNVQPRAGNRLLSLAALQEMDAVEQYLRERYDAGFLLSPLALIKSIHKSTHAGSPDAYRLPDTEQELAKILALAEKQKLWKKTLPVMNGDFSIGRITGRTQDEGSRQFKQKNQALDDFLRTHTHLLTFRVTGAAQLMDNANHHIAWNLTKGILLAIVLTTLIIGRFTASWKLALLSLVPNLLPLLFVLGMMGLMGISLKVATALIFTIAYGIAVDDTIHFLNSYRLNRQAGADIPAAIGATLTQMWRPMLYTSLVLFMGFLIFTLSEFTSISMLGTLTGGALILALLADLLLLPALLHLGKRFFARNPHTPPATLSTPFIRRQWPGKVHTKG